MTESDHRDSSGLKPGAIGMAAIGSVAMAWMGIAIAVYFVLPLIEQAAGPITPLVYLVLVVAIMPTAVSYAIMNQRRPSAGSAYTWLWEATHPWLGLLLGWCVFTLYGIVGVALQPLIGGQIFNSVLDLLGIRSGYGTAVVGGLVVVAISFAAVYSGVRRSTRNVIIFLVTELGVVFLLSVFLIVHAAAAGHLSAEPLNPGAATGGFSAFKAAILFGIFTLAGFDIVAPLAEESKSPKALIPKVTVAVVIVAGLIWAFSGYALAVGVPVSTMVGYLHAATQTGPVYLLAAHYLGVVGKILVIFTSVTGILALSSAAMMGGARIVYAMAREHHAPRWLGELHDEHQVPLNAMFVMVAIAIAVPIILGLWQGRSDANSYAWLAGPFVFFALVPYIFVNVANITFHVRSTRYKFNAWLNGVVPVLGIAVCVWVLYESFFHTYLAQPFKVAGGGSSVVWLSLLWAALGACWASWVVRDRRVRHHADEPVAAEEPVAAAEVFTAKGAAAEDIDWS